MLGCTQLLIMQCILNASFGSAALNADVYSFIHAAVLTPVVWCLDCRACVSVRLHLGAGLVAFVMRRPSALNAFGRNMLKQVSPTF